MSVTKPCFKIRVPTNLIHTSKKISLVLGLKIFMLSVTQMMVFWNFTPCSIRIHINQTNTITPKKKAARSSETSGHTHYITNCIDLTDHQFQICIAVYLHFFLSSLLHFNFPFSFCYVSLPECKTKSLHKKDEKKIVSKCLKS